MRKYKETTSTSLPNYTSSTRTMSSRSFTSMNSREGSPKVKDLTKWLHLSRTKLPLSSINKQERGRNSQWTKLRHSLDFIRKSKELLETNKSEKIAFLLFSGAKKLVKIFFFDKNDALRI